MSVDQQVADFVGQVVKQMGLGLQARVETNADGTRIDLEGDGAETLLARRGEGLQALQRGLVALCNRCVEGDRVYLGARKIERQRAGSRRVQTIRLPTQRPAQVLQALAQVGQWSGTVGPAGSEYPGRGHVRR